MASRKRRRPVEAVVADIEEAAAAANELVGRGKDAWDRDHIYHRIDYEALWTTLNEEVPRLLTALHRWKGPE